MNKKQKKQNANKMQTKCKQNANKMQTSTTTNKLRNLLAGFLFLSF
jgi:hypothetical protein